ncbi:hypothetical protein BT93_K1012 [Corymbia citriodora subsp. variegata]|nr:hypothetical protein BT93_K1012 [Corymbia citriodora subsp. variegata]
MLVYIRESDKDKLICHVDEKDIAEHLRMRLKKEEEEKEEKRKCKAQAQLYTIIKVARDADLVAQIGKDMYFDLVDHDKVHSFRMEKKMPFTLLKEEVAREFGVPVQCQRFWLWAKRQNHTYRPNRPLTPQEETQSVGQLREVSNKVYNAELKLFLEVELGLDQVPVSPPKKEREDILLFFKLYDAGKGELRYIGRLFAKSYCRPIEILPRLNEMAGFNQDEELELFEEIKFEPYVMCEHLDKNTSFQMSQIEDGDIICFQKARIDNEDELCYPDVPSFLEYVHNRQIVHFRQLDIPKEDSFVLELSKLHNYDEVVERVAQKVGLDDPTKIRLTSHNCYFQQPKAQPIKFRGVECLSDMLVHFNQTSDILYYEVLDIPLPELQGLKNLKVAFHHASKDEVVFHHVRLPKQSTVGDVINELKMKVDLSRPDAELRLLEVFYHKIYKIFPPGETIENINDQYWTLRAEEIPEEEKDLGPHDHLIHVYHFTKETAQNQLQEQNFGEPFLLVIHEGETLAEVKMRIQKKLQVPDDAFSKWKFAFLSLGHPEYLEDSEILSNRFQRRDVFGEWYLGLEHSDASKRSYVVNQAMEEQSFNLWKYTWKISNFTCLTRKKYYSKVFTHSDNAWRILIFPRGNNTEHLSIYLDVTDCERLPSGWSRNTHFKLILVDQNNYGNSRIKETEHNFTARKSVCGFTFFIPLSEVHDSRNGYLVSNTLTVVAEISTPQNAAENTRLAEPPANIPQVTPTDTFDTYFSNLEEMINVAESSPARGGSNVGNQKDVLLTSEAPTLEEVKKAKLSLKECLSDIFKLNIKDRLVEAVSTLSIAKRGLSQDQQKSVKAFWANFDEFTSDFLTFERDNFEFEMQKLLKDQMFVTMKKNHETHILYKQLLGDLTGEEEELNKKVEEVKSRKEKLISDWEILMVQSEEAKSRYRDQEKKVAEAEEKKRIAEETLSGSTTAWSNLKTHFG